VLFLVTRYATFSDHIGVNVKEDYD